MCSECARPVAPARGGQDALVPKDFNLGLVTTKFGQLESKDALKRRMFPQGCSPKTIPDGLDVAGMLAAPVLPPLVLGFTAILCIALGAGAAGALNQWYEADLDAKMKRTAGRPLPAGPPSVRNG